MVDSCVLSIIFKEKNTTDIYYWQGEMSINSKGTTAFGEVEINTAVYSSDDLRKNANEFYYINDSQEFILTQEEHEDQIAETQAQRNEKSINEELNDISLRGAT